MINNKTDIGLGLAALGRPEYINIRDNYTIDKSVEAFRKNTFKVLDKAYQNGIRYFDTAPSYGKGEQFLLEWHQKNNHNDIVFGTKWGYTYVANWQLHFDGKHEIKEHSLEKLVEQWETSQFLLPNLKYYQIHSATLDSGVLENTAVHQKLAALSKKFNIKIGLSTSGVHQSKIIEKALEIKANNKFLFDVFQITYNFLEQSCLEAILKLKELNKTIIIKEALANGRVFKIDNNIFILNELLEKYKVGIDAIAIRFVMDTVEPNIVLSGAFSTKQLEENLKAYDFKLTKGDLESLKSLKQNSESYWKVRNTLEWK